MKKILIALPLAAAAYGGAAWTSGRIVQQQIDAEIARVSGLMPGLKITEDQHVRGLFGSTRHTTVDIGALFNTADCPSPEATEDEAAQSSAESPLGMAPPAVEPLRVTLKQTITHGPLPGFGLPAAAAVRFEWLVNGKPVIEREGLSIEGELPVLVARYGFTGNTQVSAKGDAATVRFSGKDGVFALAWPALSVSGKAKADHSALSYAGELPELRLSFTAEQGEAITAQLRNVRFKAEHQYPIADQYFVYTGTDAISVGSLSLSRGTVSLFDALNLAVDGRSTLEAEWLESGIKLSLESLQMAEQKLGPIHYDFTLAKLDAAAYGALMQKLMTNDLGNCPTTEQTMAFVGGLSEQLPALLKAGPEFRIDRLSIGHAGSEALLSGRVTLPPAPAEALDNPAALLGQISASATLSVPDAFIQNLVVKSMSEKMATEIAIEALAESGADSSTVPAPTPEQRQQADGIAQTLVAQQLEQALAKHWIVRGKQGIESRVEYAAGVTQLNGQPLDLQGLRRQRGEEGR